MNINLHFLLSHLDYVSEIHGAMSETIPSNLYSLCIKSGVTQTLWLTDTGVCKTVKRKVNI